MTLKHHEKSNMELLLYEMEYDKFPQEYMSYHEHMGIDADYNTPVVSNKVKPHPTTIQIDGDYTQEKYCTM